MQAEYFLVVFFFHEHSGELRFFYIKKKKGVWEAPKQLR